MKISFAPVIGIATAVGLGFWFFIEKPQPERGAISADQKSPGASIRLIATGLTARELTLVGTARVTMPPLEADVSWEKPAFFHLDLRRKVKVGDQKSWLIAGGLQQAIEFKDLHIGEAEASFKWTLEPGWLGPIAYPFDSYTVEVTPVLLTRRKADQVWTEARIKSFGVEVSGANLTSTSYQKGDEQGPWFTMTVKRPVWLQFVVGLSILLLLIWAAYFPFSQKASDPAGLLAIFGGVFALRSSLLSGTPVFPSLIDYFSILVYTYVIAAIVVRLWNEKDPKKCEHCKSVVHPEATVCAACALPISPQP